MTIFQKLRARWKLVLISLVGLFVFGVVFAISAVELLTVTNTEQFCIGCHEMKDNPYAEYQGTIHDTNRTGVRATCPDCHVPHDLLPKLWRKALASNELYGKFIAHSIDTREKFKARRYELATHEWKRFESTDSAQCRYCHKVEKMNPDSQTAVAKANHAKMKTENLTCIDCHYGIAHEEPTGGPGPREIKEAAQAAKAGNSK